MASSNEDPMNLEDLPEYLKSQRENGDTGGSNLVGTGHIVVANKRSFMMFSRQTMLAMMLLGVVGMCGMVAYDLTSTKQMTVLMDIDNDAKMSQIIADSGGQIVSIKQNEDSTYEVKVDTKKSRRSFLSKLLNNKGVKEAKLED